MAEARRRRPPPRAAPAATERRAVIRGPNHLTPVVRDLGRSVRFDEAALGVAPVRIWPGGACFAASDPWPCPSLDERAAPRADHTDAAVDVAEADFPAAHEHALAAGAREWKANRSEGLSLYFLDLDGHRPELHAGALASRLATMDEAARETCGV